jgi:squalene-hopene/tetraprenyl-beta-curcumene cyclase
VLNLPQLQPRLRAALTRAANELLAARAPAGHWVGELSSSALSTATAVAALATVERAQRQLDIRHSELRPQIERGLDWLAANSNADGGWGDTILSLSNLSTTVLGWAAFGAPAGANERYRDTVARAEQWIAKNAGGLDHPALVQALIRRYGKDRTFSAPILTMCALAGRLGHGNDAWKWVPPLPFELAAFPHQLFAFLRLPVVSYALPALIAVGQARHFHRPPRNPLSRLLRNWTRQLTLDVLETIQPRNGGFLEATPLTSFVTMSLAGSGQADHAVTKRGLEFLRDSQRPDGSWPIDTNLATWLSTLAVNAIANAPSRPGDQSALLAWLLAQQHRREHPYTHAAPGGWAWTDQPGGVPDADDTAGALLALANLREAEGGQQDEEVRAAAIAGVSWLLDLQNQDGGIPTFCRGWGALPFDRSSADITAHVLRAWSGWFDELPRALQRRVAKGGRRALKFLSKVQRADGSWVPLWFGNQTAPDEANPTYGTARVLLALAEIAGQSSRSPQGEETTRHQADASPRHETPLMFWNSGTAAGLCGTRWVLAAQNENGSWGGFRHGPGSVEETALAVEALAGVLATSPMLSKAPGDEVCAAVTRGADWLISQVDTGQWKQPAPIGFYFAKLWYYERLYPLIFTVSALGRVERLSRQLAQ